MKPIDILREDFAQTLEFIDKCDDHIFKIKNWAIVTASAVIAFSISQDQDVLPLANVVLLLAFLYLELIYKSFQDTAISHTDDISKRIDKYLTNPNKDDLLSDYKHSFGGKLEYPSIPRLFKLIRNKQRRHIANFYGFIVIFSVAASLIGIFLD